MAAHYWIKLYQDILRDPKMGRLPDSAWRRCIELFLLAGEQDARDGVLPDIDDMAWQLRITREQLDTDLAILSEAGIITLDNGQAFVTNFKDRQLADGSTERWRQWRDRQRNKGEEQAPPKPNSNGRKRKSNESLAEEETEEETEPEEEKESPPTPPPAEKKTQKGPPTPASEEFPFRNNGRNQEPTPADLRFEAILDVCGLDASIPKHVNQAENAAAQLSRYTAAFILARYGRDLPSGDSWQWYYDDFRGREGQQPTTGQLVETIAKRRGKVTRPSTNGHQPDEIEAMKARVAAKLQETRNAARLAQ